MSNTRHIAAKPQDWQVRPRPPRPDPTPPPPPPEPPPPGVDVTEESCVSFSLGYQADIMRRGYHQLVAVRYSITTPTSAGEVVLHTDTMQMRHGSRIIYRDSPLNLEDDGEGLAYVGSADHPAPYGLNVPEGGRIILQNLGFKYYFNRGDWLTTLGVVFRARKSDSDDCFSASSEIMAQMQHRILGSGLMPYWTDYGNPSYKEHFISIQFGEGGDWTAVQWHPPSSSDPPGPPMPENIAEVLDWLMWLPY